VGILLPFKEMSMQVRRFAGLVFATAGTLSTAAAFAQTVGQDMKNAGTATNHAAASTVGHKTATKDTADAPKVGYHKTVNGTKKLGDKIEAKPADPK
jgi:prophage DNA circulation protein